MISVNDALLLRFKTDGTIVSKGFSASYIAVESMSPSSSEYSSQIDEDDDLVGGFNKKRPYRPENRGGEDDDDDDDDDDEDMQAKSP